MGKIAAALGAMERGLGDKPHCLGGAHPSLADIAVVCALDYLDFRFADWAWQDAHPALLRQNEPETLASALQVLAGAAAFWADEGIAFTVSIIDEGTEPGADVEASS